MTNKLHCGVDRSDPAVDAFLLQCEGLKHPVSVRLVGVTAEDVQATLAQLQETFGRRFMPTQPRQSGRGDEWIAYGTVTE